MLVAWKANTHMEKEKMRLIAYAKLLNRKINSAHKKAQNPFVDANLSYNPFNKYMYNTLVWIEADETQPTRFDNSDNRYY